MRQPGSSSLDHAIVEFGRSWYAYGGGSDEDIYVEFGIPASTFFDRLRTLVDSPVARDLDPTVRDGIRTVCMKRLRQAG